MTNEYEGTPCPDCGDEQINTWGFCESCGCDCEEMWEESKNAWKELIKKRKNFEENTTD